MKKQQTIRNDPYHQIQIITVVALVLVALIFAYSQD